MSNHLGVGVGDVEGEIDSVIIVEGRKREGELIVVLFEHAIVFLGVVGWVFLFVVIWIRGGEELE